MSGTVSAPESVTPTPLPSFRPIQVAPPDGPWALDCVSDSQVLVRFGRVVDANMNPVEINGLMQKFQVYDSRTTYINLKLNLSGGVVTEGFLFSSADPPVYRKWMGPKSAETQTELNACIATVHPAPDFIAANTYLYVGVSKSYGVYRCCYTDLMVYKVCDGLILLPAPFSLPE
jgi:hypothetical protein